MNIYLKFKIFLIIYLFAIFNPNISLANEKFTEWLVGFKGRAIAQGVSKETVDTALKNAKFLERIVALDRKQPEFFEKTYEYLEKRVDDKRIQSAKMPSTIQKHGINFDEVADIDLINSFQDSLASAANYLKTIGWNEKDKWGFEVSIDKNFDKNLINSDSRNLKNKISISQLKLLGFKNRNGSEILYADKKEGWLIRPDGEDGPIYIVFDNFLRLLEWNRSLRFAITVGTLSDKIKI